MDKKAFNKSKLLPKISFGYLTLFFLWPFAAFVRAMQDFRSPQAKTIFWLFCVFFGLAFIVPEDNIGAVDAARYARQLIELHNGSFSFASLTNLVYTEGGYVDVYQPLLTWLVASFTDNPNILFTIFAAIFGYFYVQNLWMVFQHIKQRNISLLLFLFIIAYTLANPIWNISGVRMWTAAHIFLFGLLNIYLKNNKKGFIWAASSIFVHFSFMFPVALLVIYKFIPKNVTLLFSFYIIASFINEIDFEGLRNSLEFLPEVFQPRVKGYLNEQYADSIADSLKSLSWHVIYAQIAQKFVLYVWIIVAFIYYRRWSKSLPEAKDLFLIGLYIGGFAQIASLVPSGGRFLLISNSLFWIVFIFLFSNFSVFKFRLEWIKLITYIPSIFYLIFTLRLGADYFGPLLIFGNPVFAILIKDQLPIIDFVKAIF